MTLFPDGLEARLRDAIDSAFAENDGIAFQPDDQATHIEEILVKHVMPLLGDKLIEAEIAAAKAKLAVLEKRELCAANGSQKRFVRPTIDELRDYCGQRGNGVDPEAFIDFYDSKGWKIGNQPMKDWKAAVRTWEKREVTSAQDRSDPNGNGAAAMAYLQKRR